MADKDGYPHPMQHMQAPPPGTAVVFPGATVVVSPPVGANPAQQTCPTCQAVIVTKTESKATTRTHLIALLMCFTCLWPCALCVYCSNSCRSVEHTCPNCNAYIGTYKN